jgi:hypothetical protein
VAGGNTRTSAMICFIHPCSGWVPTSGLSGEPPPPGFHSTRVFSFTGPLHRGHLAASVNTYSVTLASFPVTRLGCDRTETRRVFWAWIEEIAHQSLSRFAHTHERYYRSKQNVNTVSADNISIRSLSRPGVLSFVLSALTTA